MQFAGAVPYRDIPRTLAGADVMLHMSVTGSIDKSVLDALAAGTRVVSTSEAFTKPMPGVTHVASNAIALADALMLPSTNASEMQAYVREHYGLKQLIGAVITALR